MKKTKKNKKTSIINIRCTKEDKEIIKKKSDKLNMTISDYMLQNAKHGNSHNRKKEPITPDKNMAALSYHAQCIINIMEHYDMDCPAELRKEVKAIWNMLP